MGQRTRDQLPALFQGRGGAGGGSRVPQQGAPNGMRSSGHANATAPGPSPTVRAPLSSSSRPSAAPGPRPHQQHNKGKAPIRLPDAPTGARAAAAARSKVPVGAKRTLAATGQPRTSPGHKKQRPDPDPRSSGEAGRPRQQQGAPQAPSGHAAKSPAKKPPPKKPLPKRPLSTASAPRRASPASFRSSPLSGSSPLVRAAPKKAKTGNSSSGAKGAAEPDHGGLVLLLDKDRVARGEPGFTAKGLKAALQTRGCPATIKEFKLPPGAGNFLFILSPGLIHGTPDPLDGVVVPFAGVVLPAAREGSSSGLLPRSSDPRPTYDYFTDISANPRGLVLLEGDCGSGSCAPGPVEDASELDDDIDGDGWSVIRCGADDTARLISEAARSLSGSAEQLSDLLWYSQYPEAVSEALKCPLITLRQLKDELQEDELPGDELPGSSADDDAEEEEVSEKENEKGKGKLPMHGSPMVSPRTKASKLGEAKAVGRKSKPAGTPEAAKKPPLQRTPSKQPREPHQQVAAEGSTLGSGGQPGSSARPPLRQEQSGAGRPRAAPSGAKQGRADSRSDGGGQHPQEPGAAAARLRVVQPGDDEQSPTRAAGPTGPATPATGGPSLVSVAPHHKQQRPRNRMESVRKKTNRDGLAAAFAGRRGAEGGGPSTEAAAPRRPPETSKAPVEREQQEASGSNQPAGGDDRCLQVNGSTIVLLNDDDDDDEEEPLPQSDRRGGAASRAPRGGAAGVKEEEPQPRQQQSNLVRLHSGEVIHILSSSSDEEDEEEGQQPEGVQYQLMDSSSEDDDEEGHAAEAEGHHMMDLD